LPVVVVVNGGVKSLADEVVRCARRIAARPAGAVRIARATDDDRPFRAAVALRSSYRSITMTGQLPAPA